MKDKLARADVNFFAMMNREDHKRYEKNFLELRQDIDLLAEYLSVSFVEKHRSLKKDKKL